jgi:hypothetical protein
MSQFRILSQREKRVGATAGTSMRPALPATRATNLDLEDYADNRRNLFREIEAWLSDEDEIVDEVLEVAELFRLDPRNNRPVSKNEALQLAIDAMDLGHEFRPWVELWCGRGGRPKGSKNKAKK